MLRTTGWGVTATCTMLDRHFGQTASVSTTSERDMRFLFQKAPLIPQTAGGFGRVIRQFKIRSLRIHSRECCPAPTALARGGDIARQAVCLPGVCLPTHLAPSAATTRRSFRSRTDRTKASVSRRHSRGLVVGVSRSVQIADVLIGKSLGIDFRMHRIGIYLATRLVWRRCGGVRGWA